MDSETENWVIGPEAGFEPAPPAPQTGALTRIRYSGHLKKY